MSRKTLCTPVGSGSGALLSTPGKSRYTRVYIPVRGLPQCSPLGVPRPRSPDPSFPREGRGPVNDKKSKKHSKRSLNVDGVSFF